MAKQLARGVLATVAVLSFGACAFTDPGTGTNTLITQVDMGFSTASAESSAVQVSVQRGGIQVTDANIVLTDTDTSQDFTINPVAVANGGTVLIKDYHRYMQVRISSNADALTCQLEGPSKHTVTAPLSGVDHKLGEDLQVNWTSPDGTHADSVVVILEKSKYKTTLPNDDGWFTVPGTLLGQAFTNETLSVQRVTQVVPAGGANGSIVRTTFESKVTFNIK